MKRQLPHRLDLRIRARDQHPKKFKNVKIEDLLNLTRLEDNVTYLIWKSPKLGTPRNYHWRSVTHKEQDRFTTCFKTCGTNSWVFSERFLFKKDAKM